MRVFALGVATALACATTLQAQHGQMMSDADMKAMAAHMEMTGKRSPNSQDSIRAAKLVQELRSSIMKRERAADEQVCASFDSRLRLGGKISRESH